MRRTILVVEDQTNFRRLVRHALSRRFRVLEAEDASEAIDTLETERIDLVLLDLHLPPDVGSPREGLRVQETVRKRFPETKVVLLTAEEDPEIRHQACTNGALAWIEKPLEVALLQAALDRVLGALDGGALEEKNGAV